MAEIGSAFKTWMLMAVMGLLIVGVTYGQDEDSEPTVEWVSWSTNDAGSLTDHGLKWKFDHYEYADFKSDVASADASLETGVELPGGVTGEAVVVAFDIVYPMYGPVVSVEYEYVGNVASRVTDMSIMYSDVGDFSNGVAGLGGGMDIIGYWIYHDGVYVASGIGEPYVGVDVGMGLPVPTEVADVLASLEIDLGFRLEGDGDLVELHLLVLFTQDLQQSDSFSLGVGLELSEIISSSG